jgi:hypothetical protein
VSLYGNVSAWICGYYMCRLLNGPVPVVTIFCLALKMAFEWTAATKHNKIRSSSWKHLVDTKVLLLICEDENLKVSDNNTAHRPEL